jgi:cobalamin biosynthesis protein CbiD
VTRERVQNIIASEATAVVERLKVSCALGREDEDALWTVEQARNVAEFARTLGGEGLVNLWNNISSTKCLVNIKKLHNEISKELVASIQESRNIK